MAPRFLLLLLPFLAACGEQRLPQVELTGSSLGTTFRVAVVEPSAALDTGKLEADILASLERIDALASTWRVDSELSIFNADPAVDWIAVSPEFCAVLSDALAMGRLTNGAFDVTVGPLVNLWGFGPDGPVGQPPPEDAIAKAMQSVGYARIETDCDNNLVHKKHVDTYVDLSGWAKGYAVDELAGVLDRYAVKNYLVEIGGELRVKGHNSENRRWAVAIEAPSTSKRVPRAVIRVTDTSVATSGDYRNYFDHDGAIYSHTIDPRTGRPVNHGLAAVTVVYPENAFADAMATALLVLGPNAGPSLAGELGIAAYFLVRTEAGIEEIATPEFELISKT